MTLPVLFSRSSARLGRCDSSNAPRHDPPDVGAILEHLRERPADIVGLRGESEDAIGHLVHDRNPAVARHRNHAIAKIPDEIAVKTVGNPCRLTRLSRSLRGNPDGAGDSGPAFTNRHGGRRRRDRGPGLGVSIVIAGSCAGKGLLHLSLTGVCASRRRRVDTIQRRREKSSNA